MHIADNTGRMVLKATRDFKCCAGCCWFACLNCCAYEIVVESPVTGEILGYVRQTCSVWRHCFDILDENHEKVLEITGPWCICECPCCDINFTVVSY